MFHQMPTNVLKSQGFRLFDAISAGAGAGLMVMGCSRDFMKLSPNQEDSFCL
jgi:hypothetical protein